MKEVRVRVGVGCLVGGFSRLAEAGNGCALHNYTVHTPQLHNYTVQTPQLHDYTVHTPQLHIAEIHIVHLQTAQLQIAQLNIEHLHIAQYRIAQFHFAQLHISQLHKRVEADSAIGLQCHAIKTSPPHTQTHVRLCNLPGNNWWTEG